MKSFKGVMSISKLIGAVIIAIVLGALIGTITDSTIGMQGTGNVTGATSVMVGLIPLFLVIAVLVSYISDI